MLRNCLVLRQFLLKFCLCLAEDPATASISATYVGTDAVCWNIPTFSDTQRHRAGRCWWGV